MNYSEYTNHESAIQEIDLLPKQFTTRGLLVIITLSCVAWALLAVLSSASIDPNGLVACAGCVIQ